MNNIDLACVVNFRLDNEPNAFSDENASKLQALEQAKVVYLLYNHSSNTPDIFKSYCLFHEEIIKQYYQNGDVILLEEDSSLKSEKLNRNFIPTLNPSKYCITGWDDHDICEKANVLCESENRLKKATHTILSDNIPSKSDDENWKTFLEFAKTHNINGLSQADIDKHLNNPLSKLELLKFEHLKKITVMKCNIEMEKSRLHFIYDTFQKRQDSLEQCIEKKSLEKRRIFVLAGRNHGNPTDERIKPIIESHFQKLKASFVVIDPKL